MAEPSPLGPYELVSRLGTGGMAEVWKAKMHGVGGFERTMVVKRILPHLADEEHFIALFLSEARLSALLHHANIVDVFACGEIDGRYYMAMEYVHGYDLAGLLRAHAAEGPPDPGLAAFVVREVCRALAYAHQLCDERGRPLGLVHRDVSLSNVMVSYDGAVKLLDFGIAKALGALRDRQTRVDTLDGKRGYLAPEALAGRPIDERADQYAAGVVLHELLTGVRLFSGQGARRARASVPPPSHVNPRVPPELDGICLRALQRDRELRFASCDEMAFELDAAAHHLAWGPRQLSELLDRLLPGARPRGALAPTTESLSLPPSTQAPPPSPPTVAQGSQPLPPPGRDSPPQSPPSAATDLPVSATVDPLAASDPPAPRRRRLWLGASAFVIAIGVAWTVARWGARSPVSEKPRIPSLPAAAIAPRLDGGAAEPAAPPSEIVVTPLHPSAPTVEPPSSPPPNLRPHPRPGKRPASPQPNLLDGDMLNPFPR